MPAPNLRGAPPDAKMHRLCPTYRRAFGISMPERVPGNGDENADLILQGMVGQRRQGSRMLWCRVRSAQT